MSEESAAAPVQPLLVVFVSEKPHDGGCYAGLVSTLGPAALPSIVQAALQSSQQRTTFPQALLHQAHSIDQQGAQLLSHRGQGILAGLAGLQAYSAALRLVLGQDYSDSSQHSQWACAAEAAIVSTNPEVHLPHCLTITTLHLAELLLQCGIHCISTTSCLSARICVCCWQQCHAKDAFAATTCALAAV